MHIKLCVLLVMFFSFCYVLMQMSVNMFLVFLITLYKKRKTNTKKGIIKMYVKLQC
jgi:hypothetical protein